MRFIVIDPSCRSVGVAIFDTDSELPVYHGVLRGPQSLNYHGSAINISEKLSDLVVEYGPEECYIEEPIFRSDAHGIRTARTGALVKLAIGTGVLACAAAWTGCAVHMVSISSWKGNKKKPEVILEICDRLGVDGKWAVADAWDAVGIGLHLFDRGEFDRD